MNAGAGWKAGRFGARLCAGVVLWAMAASGLALAQEPAQDPAPPPDEATAPPADDTAAGDATADDSSAQSDDTSATSYETSAPPDESAETPPADAAVADPAPPEPYPETIPVPVAAEPAPAPAADAPAQLDEITVTAQKRGNELIKDVPISISVVDDEMIFDWGITNVREVMLFVPNVKVEEAGYFMLPRIRGFTTNNNNRAFEPPAGVALDGIPYGRIEYFNAGLFDIQRVEVLRGPQGTTFGKNTTAGLIHIISRNPTEEFKGFVDMQRGSFDRERLEFGVGGAAIEGFMNVRISGMTDTRRGFVYNTTAAISPAADEFLQGKDNGGFRAKLQFPDLLGSNFMLTYESLQLGSLGSGIEIIDVTEEMAATLRQYDPNVDLVGGNYITSLDYPDYRLTDIQTINGEWNYTLGTWGLAAIGGQSVMETEFFLDTDFSPAPAILGQGIDTAPTTTLELRTSSPSFDGLFGLGELFDAPLGDSDFLIGFFTQRSGIEDGYFDFAFPHSAFAALTAAAEGSGNDDVDPPLGDFIGVAPPISLLPDEGIDQVRQFFEQHSDTRAVFAQAQWRFVPGWALQLGGRYSVEKKDAWWNSTFTSPPPNAIVQAAGIEEFTTSREREDKFFQPKVSLNWQPWDSMSVFVHWAKSFKAGGYNAFAFREVEDQLGFKPEFTQEWGADIKGTFLHRTLKLNLSAYRMDVEDFQVLTREPQQATTGPPPRASTIGLGISKVINAPLARAQGIEGDITWLMASWVRWFVTLGYNDTEYLDHKKNDCAPDRDSSSMPYCDATGMPFAFAPKYNGTATALFTAPWNFFGLDFTSAVSAEYASWQHTDIDLDERKIQDAYWRYRASVGFGNQAQGWSFKLIGENLTDEVTFIRKGDLAPKQFVGITEPPRQIYGQFRWTF